MSQDLRTAPPPPPAQREPKPRRNSSFFRFERRIRPIHLMRFSRHLAVFLSAGIPILDALAIIGSDTPDRVLRRVIASISEGLRAGENFSSAVTAHAYAFPVYFVAMLRSAEVTGNLDTSLEHIARYLGRDIAAKKKVRAALTYPIVVIFLALISVGIMVTFVLPRFKIFFSEFNAKLPLPTRMLITAANVLTNKKVLAIGAAVIVGLLLSVLIASQFEGGRRMRDRILIRLPVFGKLFRYSAIGRFCRILSTMVQAGVPLPEALHLAADGTSNRSYAPRLETARTEMMQGAGMYGPLGRSGLFPPAALQMIRVGEETGTLDARLEDVSEFYEEELDSKLKNLTDLLEPVAILTVGVIVGFVAVALISAIYGVYSQVK